MTAGELSVSSGEQGVSSRELGVSSGEQCDIVGVIRNKRLSIEWVQATAALVGSSRFMISWG